MTFMHLILKGYIRAEIPIKDVKNRSAHYLHKHDL